MAFYAAEEETLDRDALDRLQRCKLSDMLKIVLASNAFYARKLAGVRFDPLHDPLERLPVTTRGELQENQAEHPPYGSNLTYPLQRYVRMHQTSASTGTTPLRWLDTKESWAWFKHCWAILFHAAGLQPADRFVFPFSFGPFVGFWAAFESALDLGNISIAAGGMTTSARIRLILEHAATVICCTPTYALRMAEVAAAEGLDLARSPVRALIVAGEQGGNIPTTRSRIEGAWGARVFDHTGMTEIGSCGFECAEAPGGLHVIESEFIPEVIEPSTGAAVPEGEIGELVLTNLGRWGSPLIRYRTGDQVRMLRRRCACGRWFARLEGGILGRTDEMLVIRGNNVFPSVIEEIVRSFDEAVEFRLVVDRGGALAQLRIEVEARAGADSVRLGQRVGNAVRDRLHFRPEVSIVAPETLPRFEMKARRVAYADSGTAAPESPAR